MAASLDITGPPNRQGTGDSGNIRAKAAQPASAPKPGKPGSVRTPGSRNRRLAPRHDVGKKTKRELTLKAKRECTG